MNNCLILIFAGLCSLFLSAGSVFAQPETTWDNISKREWNSAFRNVEIPSSTDGKIQKAFIYTSRSQQKKPLIVSLHTWSGDYSQEDPLAREILARDWNYIHPDFRGANKTFESMGSNLVVSDIDDAIQFALKNTNADPEDVHIIGVSGGGMATLTAYMNLRYPVKSFSAWAPISDLEAWYWESVGRKQKYAADIINALSKDSVLNKEEAIRRSPLYQKFPRELRKGSRLFIYEGIHDGYTGSVPITHSINMYNRLLSEIKYKVFNSEEISRKSATDKDMVSDAEIINLLTKRINPEGDKKKAIFGRSIYLSREFENIQLTVFEGGHEQLPQALGLIPVKTKTDLALNIFTLGDSNGANPGGWVDQLKAMMPNSNFVNISRGGRTIGFDNNGSADLNALRNIDNYLDDAQKQIGKKKFDYVIVCLGTNDTKKDFADRQAEVVANFDALLTKIKSHQLSRKSKPKFIYVTPPPIRTTNILAKYAGANERLGQLVPKLSELAQKKGFDVIDAYHPLLGILDYYAADGVHMYGEGQQIISAKIVEKIEAERMKK
ncbi:MAG TPA: GDSL-type esterase/lipase family protein [Prolixibacteraceae bacterium]|nr:GDSL-type esterase/lipase family protein [Prolixibacteraceae bacterium]